MNWLRNLKIVHKLMLLLGIVIVGFMLIGAAYYQGSKYAEHALAEERKAIEFGHLVALEFENFLLAESLEKTFLLGYKRANGPVAQLDRAAPS